MKKKHFEKIIHDPYTRSILSSFKKVFLVGGYIRDTLLNRPAMDRDYAVDSDPLRAAQRVQKKFPGKIIQFRDNLTVRIALKRGGNIDFTRLNGSIEHDLEERDFTINAMAYHDREGLIDPWGGRRDLRDRCIRATRHVNMINDPLRTLRAFRFMSELGWDIEQETMNGIRYNCGLISQSASERITFEFIQLMNGNAFMKALRGAQKSGLLRAILCSNNNRISNNINNMVQINDFIKALPHHKFLKEEVSQGLSKRSMILLTALLNNLNTSSTLLTINNKYLDFKNNTEKCNKYYKKGALHDKGLLELFRSMKDYHRELGIYAMDPDLLKKAGRFMRIRKRPLLNGREIADITGARGPELGKTIKMLESERFFGKIRKKSEAVAYLKSHAILPR